MVKINCVLGDFVCNVFFYFVNLLFSCYSGVIGKLTSYLGARSRHTN